MQKTKFDHWLLRKYVHINRIYFNTMPSAIPRGMDFLEAEGESGGRYKYRCSTRDEFLAKELCEVFVNENITFASRVDERDTSFANFVGNPKRSVTMMLIWIGLTFMAILFTVSGVTQMALSAILQDKDAVMDEDQAKKAAALERM